MKTLEKIELESYETPALQEIATVSMISVAGASQDPEQSGGDDPVSDDDL